MKTAILTGFLPFGRYVVNPTDVLARCLSQKTLAGHKIHSMVFPPTVLSPVESPDYGKEIVDTASAISASVIISLGMASEVRGVRIEAVCENWVENGTYCTLFENRKPVFSDCAPHEKRLIPLQPWDIAGLFRKLSVANISLEMSADAGNYCCNALMFRVLRALEQSPRQIPFLFAHVPCTKEAISEIPDFDRTHKMLLCQGELPTIVEKLLESYHLPTG